MTKALCTVLMLALSLAVVGCKTPDKSGKPAPQVGTPPPSAGDIPPPLPPGKTPSGGGIQR